MSDLDRTWRLTCVGGMAAIMAHRLAQPMTAINALAASSLKAARNPEPDKVKLIENLTKIEQQARRATDMIRGFAQFAHHGAPDIGSVDLDSAITAVLEPLAEEATRHGITVRREVAPGLPAIAASPMVVEQVASCLVRNAIDALIGDGGGARQISIAAATTDDGMVEIAVTDSGPGIDPDIARAIFDPFSPGRPGECGVGLAVSRAMVEALGGHIAVKSGEGGGAVVAFALPATKQGDAGERRAG